MTQILEVRPVNSIVFVHGGGDFEVPAETFEPDISLVAASPTCLIVGLFPEIDGPTELRIGAANEVDPGMPPAFAGMLATPDHILIVDTVSERIVYKHHVRSTLTAIKVWLSHPRWPEQVSIGID